MNINTLFAVIFLCVTTVLPATAHEGSFSLGVSGGYVMSFHTGTFNFENIPDSFPRHAFDMEGGYRFGVVSVLPLESSGRLSLGLTIGIASASNSKDEIIAVTPVHINGKVLYLKLYNTVSFVSRTYVSEATVRLTPFDNYELGFIVGGGLSYCYTDNYKQTIWYQYSGDVIIIDPDLSKEKPIINNFPLRYTNRNFNEILVYEGALPEANSWQAYLRTGIFYGIPLSKRLLIAPSVTYDFPLMNVSSSQSWRIHHFAYSLDVRYRL